MKNNLINLDKKKLLVLIALLLLCSCNNTVIMDKKDNNQKKDYRPFIDSPIKLKQDSDKVNIKPEMLLTYNQNRIRD